MIYFVRSSPEVPCCENRLFLWFSVSFGIAQKNKFERIENHKTGLGVGNWTTPINHAAELQQFVSLLTDTYIFCKQGRKRMIRRLEGKTRTEVLSHTVEHHFQIEMQCRKHPSSSCWMKKNRSRRFSSWSWIPVLYGGPDSEFWIGWNLFEVQTELGTWGLDHGVASQILFMFLELPLDCRLFTKPIIT